MRRDGDGFETQILLKILVFLIKSIPVTDCYLFIPGMKYVFLVFRVIFSEILISIINNYIQNF